MTIKVTPGFAEAHRAEAAELFWQAFEGKLMTPLGPREKALRFIAPNLSRNFAFSACAPDGSLLGVAGIKTEKGGFLTGDLKDLNAIYGRIGGLWRGILLEQFERPVASGTLLMDGIFVKHSARGQGVGTELLKAIIWTAEMNGYQDVRLDVIDTNPRARALYERRGFAPAGTVSTGLLAPLMGFKTATTMLRPVAPAGDQRVS